MSVEEINPFKAGVHGGTQTYYGVAEDRIRAVAWFDRAQCEAALKLPGLQKTVAAAVQRRLRYVDKVATVLHFTDFSCGRKEMLKRELKASSSEEQILALCDAMIAERNDPVGELLAAGHHRSALARGDGLAGMERETGEIAMEARVFAVGDGSQGASGVFDERKTVTTADLGNLGDPRRIAKLVDHHHRLETAVPQGGHPLRDLLRRNHVRTRLDIAQRGFGPRRFDHVGRGRKSKCRRENRVAGADVERLERQMQRGGSRRNGDGMRQSGERFEFPLESGDIFPLDQHARTQDIDGAREVLVAQIGFRQSNHVYIILR